MKKNALSSDLARIKSVIEGDRRNVSADVEKMLKYDLTCVLRGYFESCTVPEIAIDNYRGGIKVTISVAASCIKRSGTRPSECGIIA